LLRLKIKEKEPQKIHPFGRKKLACPEGKALPLLKSPFLKISPKTPLVVFLRKKLHFSLRNPIKFPASCDILLTRVKNGLGKSQTHDP
jgi:hypothetical protein